MDSTNTIILHVIFPVLEHNNPDDKVKIRKRTFQQEGNMKKAAAVLILTLLIAFALVGCNVASNIPETTSYTTTTVTPYTTTVTPYATTDNIYGNEYNGANTTNSNPVTTNPNARNTTGTNVVTQ